jgi:hypothetical protein
VGGAMSPLTTGVLGAALLLGAHEAAAFSPSTLPLRTPVYSAPTLGLRKGVPGGVVVSHWRRAARARLTWVMSGPGDPSGKRENEDDEAMPLGFRRSDNGTRDAEFEGLVSKRDGNDNIYIQMIESISPGEMVGQFMNSASPRVQQAVKSTIMGLLGR